MIPKTKAMQTPDSLRPIALQTTGHNWLTNILLIQLEDVLLHCIPARKRASFVTEVSCNMSMVRGLCGMACKKERRCQWTSKMHFPRCHTRGWRRHWV